MPQTVVLCTLQIKKKLFKICLKCSKDRKSLRYMFGDSSNASSVV